jgi:hypothetical protein
LHLDTVEMVEDGKVVLNRTGAQARDEWGVREVWPSSEMILEFSAATTWMNPRKRAGDSALPD